MSDSEEERLKRLAQKAKGRLKAGFWKDYDTDMRKAIGSTSYASARRSEIVRYYRTKAQMEIDSQPDDAFYYKVKAILDSCGEVSDIIGRLIDENAMRHMTFLERQRYVLDISEKYRMCRERYEQEKKYEFSDPNEKIG